MAEAVRNTMSELKEKLSSRQRDKTASEVTPEVAYARKQEASRQCKQLQNDLEELYKRLAIWDDMYATCEDLCKRELLDIDANETNDLIKKQIALAQEILARVQLGFDGIRFGILIRRHKAAGRSGEKLLADFPIELFPEYSKEWDLWEDELLLAMLDVFTVRISLEHRNVSDTNARPMIIDTTLRRRRSNETMSTMSIPSPPYGLVDCSETKRQQDLTG